MIMLLVSMITMFALLFFTSPGSLLLDPSWEYPNLGLPICVNYGISLHFHQSPNENVTSCLQASPYLDYLLL